MGATRLQIIRGTDEQRQAVTFLVGELAYTTDLKELWVGDGATLGGIGPFRGMSGIVGAIIDDTQEATTTVYSSDKIGELLAALQIAWDSVTDKPLTYPPEAHGHDWSDITNEPTDYPPEAHGHAIADVTGLEDALASAGGGHAIQDEGTPLTQRANLDFVGDGVTVTDDEANDKTIVTIEGGGGGSAAVSDWQTYTPTVANLSGFAAGYPKGFYRRVGDALEVVMQFLKDTSAGASSGIVSFGLPSGLEIDTSKTDLSVVVGEFSRYTTAWTGQGIVLPTDTTSLRVFNNGDANALQGGSFPAWAQWTIHAIVPIVGWSSNIQLASAATEYAYNTDTGNADYTGTDKFGYGAAGNLIGIATTPAATCIKRLVRFATPIQPGDVIAVEVDLLGNGEWMPIPVYYGTNGVLISSLQYYGAAYVGIGGLEPVNGSQTDIYVRFGKYLAITDAWSYLPATARWRVRKSSGASMAEIPTDTCAMVEAKLTANQAISALTFTKVNLATEVKDVTGEFSGGTFTANRAKRVLVTFNSSASGGTGNAAILVYKNGASVDAVIHPQGNYFPISTAIDLALGDYLEIYCRLDTAANLMESSTRLQITELSPRRLI